MRIRYKYVNFDLQSAWARYAAHLLFSASCKYWAAPAAKKGQSRRACRHAVELCKEIFQLLAPPLQDERNGSKTTESRSATHSFSSTRVVTVPSSRALAKELEHPGRGSDASQRRRTKLSEGAKRRNLLQIGFQGPLIFEPHAP